MNHVFSFAFNAGVDIRDTKLSNLVILSYTVAFKKSIKMFYYYSITSFSRGMMEVGDWGRHWLVWMEWRPAGWSVCLPMLIFSCTIKSRSSLLALAYPGGPGKRAVKRLWCGVVWYKLQQKFHTALVYRSPFKRLVRHLSSMAEADAEPTQASITMREKCLMDV